VNRSKYKQIAEYYPYLKHPEKYTGRRPITLRSSYEIKFVKGFLDSNPSVMEWSSEDHIKYKYDIDKKIHRYFIDFWVKVNDNDGDIKEYLVEVKPKAKLQKPKKPKRVTKAYNKRLAEWVKNENKFDAAKLFCAKVRRETGRKLYFQIFTESDLGIKL